jgi:hypothetical protein
LSESEAVSSWLCVPAHFWTHVRFPQTAQFALDKLSPSTRELSLGHNHLGSEGVIHLFTRLKELRREWATSGVDGEDRTWGIEKITLSSNEIQSDALVAIADYLDGDETLKELYLPHNRIRVGVVLTGIAGVLLRVSLKVVDRASIWPSSVAPWPLPLSKY